MKPSRYNYLFRFDGRVTLAYNTLTTALVSLSEEEADSLQGFFRSPEAAFFESRDLDDWQDQLLEMGFIVPDDVDELVRIRAVWRMLQQDRRHLGLTLMPTLDCNLRCGYCFSYAHPQRMGRAVQEALLRLVEEKLHQVEDLSVTWYGGEPTLCLGLIENLSAELGALCDATGATFAPGHIVTNGYLLAPPVAERLRAAGITGAQVTLDGDRDTHNQRRPLAGGQGTFDRILDNLAASCDLLEIQVRINIDRSNAAAALGALDALASRDLQRKVGVYFGQVKAYTEACADVEGACLTDQEFSAIDLHLTREALRRGFSSFSYPQQQLSGACGAVRPLSYVVAPNGLLFKCWSEASLGERWSVGSLLADEPTGQQAENLQGYLRWDPTAEETCEDCRLLPLCMGGCPYLRIRRPAQLDCSKWRYNLLDTLGMRYAQEEQRERIGSSAAVASGSVGDRAVLRASAGDRR